MRIKARLAAWVVASLNAAIRLYQWLLSPLLGANCRYAPSCSEYAREALAKHGVRAGLWLALKRLARCHPWGGSGHDPVPKRKLTAESSESL